MRDINRIYIHCTASEFGDVPQIDEWHRKRGFEAQHEGTTYHIGYHYLVLNSHITAASLHKPVADITDGKVMPGRPLFLVGAHVKGDNTNSIGIAYVGFTPTPAQYNALMFLCRKLMGRFIITIESVLGHHEYYLNSGQLIKKTCPNMDMECFRNALSVIL